MMTKTFKTNSTSAGCVCRCVCGCSEVETNTYIQTQRDTLSNTQRGIVREGYSMCQRSSIQRDSKGGFFARIYARIFRANMHAIFARFAIEVFA